MKSADVPVYVLIPAYQEEDRIADTVAAARRLPGVVQVLVIDDGSTDETAARAERAGATVLRLVVNSGKGAALRAGLAACPAAEDDIILLLDADVGASAAEALHLLAPVQAGEADLTIARFPRLTVKTGFGLVKGLARLGTWLLTGRWLDAPLSGQRACRRWVLSAAPFAERYGIEVAMNIAAGDAGARIREVPVAMTHAVTGRTLAGFAHRGRQGGDIARALLAAAFGRTGGRLIDRLKPARVLCWLLALGAVGWPSFTLLWENGLPMPWLLLAALLGLPLAAIVSGLWHARRPNYRARYLPALGGLMLVPTLAMLLILLPSWPATPRHAAQQGYLFPLLLPLSLLGWMLLGLLDDLWGNADRKGFRGHVHALLQGTLTTGGMKLLGGGLLALIMAWFVAGPGPSRLIAVPVTALLIALSANTMNLFDLRPGRALKLFWLSAALLLAVLLPGALSGAGQPYLPTVILLFVLASLCYAPLDFAGMMMLGDTGSNVLGAFLGTCLAVTAPLPVQGALVVALIGLHLYTERVSLTRLIERVPWLRWLDRLGRSD